MVGGDDVERDGVVGAALVGRGTERSSYETNLAVFLGLVERESETRWAQAECAAAMGVRIG